MPDPVKEAEVLALSPHDTTVIKRAAPKKSVEEVLRCHAVSILPHHKGGAWITNHDESGAHAAHGALKQAGHTVGAVQRLAADRFRFRVGGPKLESVSEAVQATTLTSPHDKSVHPAEMVDGEAKHTHNSEGKLIHPTAEGRANFHRWSGGTHIADKHGRPLVMYHGTDANFDAFKDTAASHGVHFLTPNAGYGHVQKSASVKPVYAKAKSVHHTDYQKHIEGLHVWPEHVKELKDKGHDAVVYSKKGDITKGSSGWGNDYAQVAVFHPHQIKSATGNTGAFSAGSDHIGESLLDRITRLISEAAPVVDHAVTHEWDDIEHGKPATFHVYRGEGGNSRRSLLTPKLQGDLGREHLLGQGRYYTPSKATASNYGEPQKYRVSVKNPHVVHSYSLDAMRSLDLDAIKKAGHDSVIIKKGSSGQKYGNENMAQVAVFGEHPSEKVSTNATNPGGVGTRFRVKASSGMPEHTGKVYTRKGKSAWGHALAKETKQMFRPEDVENVSESVSESALGAGHFRNAKGHFKSLKSKDHVRWHPNIPKEFKKTCEAMGAKVKSAGTGGGLVLVFEDMGKCAAAHAKLAEVGIRCTKHDLPGILYVQALIEGLHVHVAHSGSAWKHDNLAFKHQGQYVGREGGHSVYRFKHPSQAKEFHAAVGKTGDKATLHEAVDAFIDQTGDSLDSAEKSQDGAEHPCSCGKSHHDKGALKPARPESDFDPKALKAGTDHEMEHTKDRETASMIARHHLAERPDYYEKLDKAGLGEAAVAEDFSEVLSTENNARCYASDRAQDREHPHAAVKKKSKDTGAFYYVVLPIEDATDAEESGEGEIVGSYGSDGKTLSEAVRKRHKLISKIHAKLSRSRPMSGLRLRKARTAARWRARNRGRYNLQARTSIDREPITSHLSKD